MAAARRLRTYLTRDQVAWLRAVKKNRRGARNHAVVVIATGSAFAIPSS
jgi:hypothetical protein